MRLSSVLAICALLCVCQRASGISNDIVATMRCRLLCKEADGHGSQVGAHGICKCTTWKRLSDAQQTRVQELSATYDMPVRFFEREHRNYKVKRQLDENLLEDLRSKLDDHWAETAEGLRSWREQQARATPLTHGIAEQAENWKAWHRQQIDASPLLADLEEHAENLQAWHNDNVEMLKDGLQEHQAKFEEHVENLKDLGDVNVGAIGPKLEEHAQQIRDFHEEHIKPLLGEPAANLEEAMEKLKALHQQQVEPVLGQMAPYLTTYDSKATGIGGSNVNFPTPNYPNPFVPGMAHIFRSLQPSWYAPVGAPAPAPTTAFGPPPPFGVIPPFPRVHSRINEAATLPARLAGLYDPKNPIVVQPIVLPNHDQPTPKPILSSLQNRVDDMLANLKKNGGRLVPENYMNSDAMSNSESQVNQINVNVRVEPTPTPPNLYSAILPWNRQFLTAPRPKEFAQNIDGITENPGFIDDDEGKNRANESDEDDTGDDEEDIEEERRMEKQLKDADKRTANSHVVDSVKKNLDQSGVKRNQYTNNALILQPEEFMQDTEEDLQTLAK